MPVSGSSPRPRWRRVLRWLLLPPLILIGLPLLAFVVGNRIDEPQNAAASRYAAQWHSTVPDEENAWLLLAGLDAPPNADPIAWARARVDAFNASVAAAPRYTKGLTPPALPADATPRVMPGAATHGFAAHCEPRTHDCLVWAARHRDGLERLRADNAVRLARYLKATTLPRWRTLHAATADTPLVDVSASVLQLQLIASGLAQPDDAAGTMRALDALASELAFWRRVRAQPQDLFALLVSTRRSESAYWLIADWIERAPRSAIVAHEAVLDRLLAAPVAPIDWAPALGYELQLFDHSLRNDMPAPSSRCGIAPWERRRRDAAASVRSPSSRSCTRPR